MGNHQGARPRKADRLGNRKAIRFHSCSRRTHMDVYRKDLKQFDPEIDCAIAGEERRQAEGVEMIPSENYTYPEVLAALGSILTSKDSEGSLGRRYDAGRCR